MDPFLSDLQFGSKGQHSIRCQAYLGLDHNQTTVAAAVPAEALQVLQHPAVTFDHDL